MSHPIMPLSGQPLAALRGMRERLRAATRRGLLAVVDVGSAKTACFVLRVDAARLERAHAAADAGEGGALDALGAVRVIGVGVFQSQGVRLGEIVDMEAAGRSLRGALEQAERMAGERVDQAVATFAGGRPRSGAAHGLAMVEGMAVSARDVSRAAAACRIARDEGRALLHAQPVNFEIDGVGGLNDPRGMSGERLGCDAHVLTVAAGPLRNLAQCVRGADLECAGVVSGAYAAGLSSLVEDEQRLGAACIDMGAGETGISVFLRGHMIHAEAVRLGGDHVTLDIAQGLAMAQADAERIKTLHGGAVATGLDDREMIEAPRLGEDDPVERRRISRAVLIGVIRPRLEETLETVRDRLRAAGFEHLPGRRIVLTGGASQLPGLEEAAQRILGRRTRVGRPMRIAGLPQQMSGPAFAAAVGLSVYAARPRDELWDYHAPAAIGGTGRVARAVRWFAENW